MGDPFAHAGNKRAHTVCTELFLPMHNRYSLLDVIRLPCIPEKLPQEAAQTAYKNLDGIYQCG